MRKSHSPFLYYNNRPISRYKPTRLDQSRTALWQTTESTLGNFFTRLGVLVGLSRRMEQNIKRFLKKLFIFSKKLCQVFEELFSSKSPKNKENPLYLQNSSENVCRFKKKPYLCIAFETRDIGRLAQLVQSICLTSRGSAVRIRQRPLLKTSLLEKRISGV